MAVSQRDSRDGERKDLLNWAVARTHLLNRITLELRVIHRLTGVLGSRTRTGDGRGYARNVESRVQTVAGRSGIGGTALELAFILRRATVCHGVEIVVEPQKSDYG